MKKIILPLLILFSVLAPALAFFLNLQSPTSYGMSFFIFIFLHTILRLWETFFTSKEKNKLTVDKDWSLIFVTTVYVLFFYVLIFEFYAIARKINIYIACFGIILYFISFGLRLWSMRILGKQWAIHALGETRVQHRRLIKIGPYKYVRHPIYVATVLEQLAALTIANAFYSFFYFCFFTVPAYFIRMYVEEVNNEKIFGSDYQSYKKAVNMFFPKMKKLFYLSKRKTFPP